MRFYSCWRISRICRARAMRRRSRRRCICTRTFNALHHNTPHTHPSNSLPFALSLTAFSSLSLLPATRRTSPNLEEGESSGANSGEGLHEGIGLLSSNMPEDNQKS